MCVCVTVLGEANIIRAGRRLLLNQFSSLLLEIGGGIAVEKLLLRSIKNGYWAMESLLVSILRKLIVDWRASWNVCSIFL